MREGELVSDDTKSVETGALTFDLDHPDGRRAMRLALNAQGMLAAICEIHTQVFRPARKHGYPDALVTEALKAADKTEIEDKEYRDDGPMGAGTLLVSRLEHLFLEILSEWSISMDDNV